MFDFLKEKKISILIAYGSETGHSKSVAEVLFKKLDKFSIFLKSLYNVDIYDFNNHHYYVFLVSTTGNGNFPQNSEIFWKNFKKYKELIPINYSLIGFGDTNYRSFCHSAKCFDRNLRNNNAKSFLKLVFIDVAKSYDECKKHIDDWMNNIYDYLSKFKIKLVYKINNF